MTPEIKSGQEVLKDFFENLKDIPDVDGKVADMLIEIFKNNKGLTEKNISNALLKLREEALK